MNRYFYIMLDKAKRVSGIIEYPHEWGYSAWNESLFKFGYTTRDRQNWFIYADDPLADHQKQQVLNNLVEGDIDWQKMDMSIADNPKSQRKPAMQKKGRK